jgi:hypothetical protein
MVHLADLDDVRVTRATHAIPRAVPCEPDIWPAALPATPPRNDSWELASRAHRLGTGGTPNLATRLLGPECPSPRAGAAAWRALL